VETVFSPLGATVSVTDIVAIVGAQPVTHIMLTPQIASKIIFFILLSFLGLMDEMIRSRFRMKKSIDRLHLYVNKKVFTRYGQGLSGQKSTSWGEC
jgi:hypothetical protein